MNFVDIFIKTHINKAKKYNFIESNSLEIQLRSLIKKVKKKEANYTDTGIRIDDNMIEFIIDKKIQFKDIKSCYILMRLPQYVYYEFRKDYDLYYNRDLGIYSFVIARNMKHKRNIYVNLLRSVSNHPSAGTTAQNINFYSRLFEAVSCCDYLSKLIKCYNKGNIEIDIRDDRYNKDELRTSDVTRFMTANNIYIKHCVMEALKPSLPEDIVMIIANYSLKKFVINPRMNICQKFSIDLANPTFNSAEKKHWRMYYTN